MTLTTKEIEDFKKRLEMERRRLTRQLVSTSAEVKKSDDVSGYSQHQADQGTDNFDRTISLELTNQERVLLRQINRALEKINENTYGTCDLTGKAISKARLDAIPYACMTVDAQDKLEKGLL